MDRWGWPQKLDDDDAYFCPKDESMHPPGVPTILLVPTHMGGQKEYYLRVRNTKYKYLQGINVFSL